MDATVRPERNRRSRRLLQGHDEQYSGSFLDSFFGDVVNWLVMDIWEDGQEILSDGAGRV